MNSSTIIIKLQMQMTTPQIPYVFHHIHQISPCLKHIIHKTLNFQHNEKSKIKVDHLEHSSHKCLQEKTKTLENNTPFLV